MEPLMASQLMNSTYITYIHGPHDTMLANRIFYQIALSPSPFHDFAPKKEVNQLPPAVDPFQVEIYWVGPFPVRMANAHL